MHFSFVILHYKTQEDTFDCIESIKELSSTEKVSIVVVDNASNNGSFEEIQNRYGSDPSVILIHNEKNLGFAQGNNIGYAYAKENDADFIAILNNDIILESDNFISQVVDCYRDFKFALMGPDIVSLVDHGHQNPPEPTTTDIKSIKKRIWRFILLRSLNRIGFYDFGKKYFGARDGHKNKLEKSCEYKENIQLHGSCLVYSPQFIKNEKYAFCPDTFLYTEEPILYQYCMRKNYKTLYNPNIVVFHKEDSSTNATYNANRQKREFVFSNLINSHRVYLEQLKNRRMEW